MTITKLETIITDIDPRFDREAAKNRLGEFLDKCDPDARVRITIEMEI